MSPAEIANERERLFQTLDPAVLQSLLRRAELKESEMRTPRSVTGQKTPSHGSRVEWFPENVSGVGMSSDSPPRVPEPEDISRPVGAGKTAGDSAIKSSQRDVAGGTLSGDGLCGSQTPASGTCNAARGDAPRMHTLQERPQGKSTRSGFSASANSDLATSQQDSSPVGVGTGLASNSSAGGEPKPDAHVHFPPPPEELRKYFPDLPVETDKLAWMQPISETEQYEYSAEMASVRPSELRFDFHGNLLTPRQSQQIPTSAGLHHHGDAPAAAGYTLPELGRLARSAHPAQRSMAIQTAGRVLHKLRKRQFAKSSDLQEGLEALVRETRLLDTLMEQSHARSLTVRALAIEALWLAHPDEVEKPIDVTGEAGRCDRDTIHK